MKKVIVIVLALSLLMVTGAFAGSVECPDYVIGYKGCITFCLAPQIVIGANGASATLSTPEGQSKTVYADC